MQFLLKEDIDNFIKHDNYHKTEEINFYQSFSNKFTIKKQRDENLRRFKCILKLDDNIIFHEKHFKHKYKLKDEILLKFLNRSI